jgi:nucleotide-binding universal stress UspA family protein
MSHPDHEKDDHMILICYDGSPDSQAAIDRVGELMPGQPATVLTVWEPSVTVIARAGAGMDVWLDGIDPQRMDELAERAARDRADQGVQRARDAGLNPQPRTRGRGATIAETNLSEADEVKATVIVLGTRGLTGLKSLLLGSVSHAVLQHADRPVIVVPSAEVAAKRAAHRR